MDLLGTNQVQGDVIRMKRTDPRHMDTTGEIPVEQPRAGTVSAPLLRKPCRGSMISR